jgi:fructoselysine 6-kinase
MLVSIGDNCIDCYVAPIGLRQVGGNALNVAANFALHGLPAAYVGVVGDDAGGDLIVAALQAIGVNTAFLMRVAGPTGLTEIELLRGDYRILKEDYGVSDQLRLSAPLLEWLQSQASRLHLTLSGRAEQLIEDLEELDLPLSVDMGTLAEAAGLQRYARLIHAAESVFVSVGAQPDDEDVQRLLAAVLQGGARYAIATRGAAGASALWQGRLISEPPALSGEALIDTLGAGDAFIAGFLSSAGSQSALQERLQRASRWSAEACSHFGAWTPQRARTLAAGPRPL